MNLEGLPQVIVLTTSHSGSRLLTRILHDNGVYMDRYRGKTGEDSRVWGSFAKGNDFHRACLSYLLRANEQRFLDMIAENDRLFHDTLASRNLKVYAHKMLSREWGRDTIHVPPPSDLRGYGFKIATRSAFFAKGMFDYLEQQNREANTYFIYLTRGLGDWLNSGLKPGTKGIPRPLDLAYMNYFADDFLKYIWFNSTDRVIELPDGSSMDLLTASEEDLKRHQSYLESLLWYHIQQLFLELNGKATNFLHVRFEDIVTKPDEISGNLTRFLGMDITVPQGKIDKSRMKAAGLPEQVAQNAAELHVKLGYPA